MTKKEKSVIIDELTQVLQDNQIVYLADTQGLDAKLTSDLRRACFKNKIQIKVVKNTLLKKAMENVDSKDFSELYGSLAGNTTMLLAEKGNAPAKLIEEFRKKAEKPVLKGAWIEEAVYVGDDQVKALASLKSKEELIGEVIGLLQSPIKTVVSQLQSSKNTLAGLVKTLADKE